MEDTSNEKDKTKKRIIIDYREKKSQVYSDLVKSGVNIEVKELKVADYIIRDIAIERKTVNDFFSSMINKRLVKQLESLQQYPNRLLLIEGIDEQELYSNEPAKEGIHPNAIRGFLISIIFRYKTPIIFSKDSSDTAKFILILLNREEKELSLNVSRKNLNKKEKMQFILEGFQGIGPKTAKKLLSHFKTIRELFESSQEELKEIIGKKAEVFKIIDEEY